MLSKILSIFRKPQPSPQEIIRKKYPRSKLRVHDRSEYRHFYVIVPDLTEPYSYHRSYGMSFTPMGAWQNTLDELKGRNEI